MHVTFTYEISIAAKIGEKFARFLYHFFNLGLSQLFDLHPSLLIGIVYSDSLVYDFHFEKDTTECSIMKELS